ncbi:hypothetical protein U9M48_005397 [Paspalum notatum var. saurae]|uniref:Uncharacterized protein n=1 Tax=Paspalum notatum var. saurae TaxID=547442 RepID=A0AAQ3SLD8_PASNO
MQLIVSIDKVFHMAKILLLASLLLYITVAEGVAPVPAAEWNAVDNSIKAMEPKLTKAFDDVILAAPEANKTEVKKATVNHMITIGLRLAKAQEKGDVKEAMSILRSYEEVAKQISAAPSSAKFVVMERTFNFANAPDFTKCPTVDKLYCETVSKIRTVPEQILSATPPAKELEVKKAIEEKVIAASTAINKAYANVDDKEIAAVLAAYNKAADAVTAAAPAEKLKVMEEAFTAAAATSTSFNPPPRPPTAAATKAEVEWSAAANKSISAMQVKVDKALRDAVLAAPPAKIPDAEKAALGQMIKIALLLANAKGTMGEGTRDEKQAISIAEAYEKAADLVIAAPPAEKLKVMEEAFKEAETPKHA